MASLFGHGAVAYAISHAVIRPQMTGLLVLGIVSAIMPDFDVIMFSFDVPYYSMWGHRGFTHSILFAVIWALVFSLIWPKYRFKAFLFLFLCTLSHGVIDAMTTGGLGIAFFAPFSSNRYFAPWQFIQVSPLSVSRFFSHWGMLVLKSEFIYLGIPSFLFIMLMKRVR